MAKVSLLYFVPPAIFAAFGVLSFWGMEREDPSALPSAFIGRDAPPVPATTLPEKIQLTEEMLREPGVKIVNFWASWCPPCRAEHPTLTDLSQKIPVYGVNLKDAESDALEFLDSHGDPFAALATDPRGRTAIEWGVTAPPETFIINGEGKVLYRYAGPLIREDFTDRFLPKLESALAAE